MKTPFFKDKGKRNKFLAVLTVFVIALSVVLNLAVTYFGEKNTVFLDMTPEGLYTPTAKFIEECKFLEEIGKEEGSPEKVEIIFCTDYDYIISSSSLRATYFTAQRLADVYDKLSVRTVNVMTNPTAVAMYKTTSLSEIKTTDIIVAYGDRYRIISAQRLWTQGSDGNIFSYNGEYKLVGLLKSVTAIDMPAAYFVTDHGETYYDPDNATSEMSLSLSSFADLLKARGLKIKLLEISKVDKIPDDCALLIINNPMSDFTTRPDLFDRYDYISDTEKIDRYLVKKQGAIMVNKDYKVTLPVLEDFLREWGFSFSSTLVKDSEASLDDDTNSQTAIISSYQTSETSYGYAIYGDLASLSSAPITVFKETGSVSCSYLDSFTVSEPGTSDVSRVYASFLTTSPAAKQYGKNPLTGEYTSPASDEKVMDLAAVSVREELNTQTGESVYSYMFCTASAQFLSNDLLGNTSYANYDVVASLINNISRIDEYGSLEIGGTSLNSSSFGGKQLVSTTMSEDGSNVYSPDGKELIRHNYGLSKAAIAVYSVIVFAIPLTVAVLGVIVRIKRKFL